MLSQRQEAMLQVIPHHPCLLAAANPSNMATMFVGEVHDEKGEDIHEGDFVFTTRLREGSHEGKVGFTTPP